MASKKDTDDYKNELQCKIKACKEKIAENDRVLLIINDQISMYKRVLDKLEPFDLKDFNKQNDRFLKDNDYLNMSSLPSIEDVINNIINYRNISNDKTSLNENELKLEKGKNNQKGWNWNISCCIENEFISCSGNIKKFINAPTELLALINHVNFFLSKLSFIYSKDSNYQELHYNRISYDSDLGEGKFRTYENGILRCFINNEKISEEDILDHLSYIKNLVDKLSNFDINITCTDKEIQEEMTELLLNDIGQGPLGYPLIEDDIDDDYYWNINSETFDKNKIINYCNTVKELVSQIELIIKSSHDNEKKAEYFKKYLEFYNKLFTQYAAVKQYKRLLDNCFKKKAIITAENESKQKEIESYESELRTLNSEESNVKKLKKRRD